MRKSTPPCVIFPGEKCHIWRWRCIQGVLKGSLSRVKLGVNRKICSVTSLYRRTYRTPPPPPPRASWGQPIPRTALQHAPRSPPTASPGGDLRWPNVVVKLGQRLRRCPSFTTTFGIASIQMIQWKTCGWHEARSGPHAVDVGNPHSDNRSTITTWIQSQVKHFPEQRFCSSLYYNRAVRYR